MELPVSEQPIVEASVPGADSSVSPHDERPQLAPFLWGVAWSGVLWWFLRQPAMGIWYALGLAVLVSLWAYRHRQHLVSPRSFWWGTAVFLLASVTMISFVTSSVAKYATLVMSGILLWAYLRQAIQQTNEELQGRMMIFIMTLSYWSGMASLYFLGIMMSWPWWQIFSIGAIWYAMVATIVWLDLRVALKTFRRALLPMVWLGAELAAVGWWLSTSVWTSSVLVTVLGMMMVHMSRHVWLDTWKPGRGKRYILLGVSVMAMVILTAKWMS